MRGDKEKECLCLLQKSLESIEEKVNFYGCSNDEVGKIKLAILEAVENPDTNAFPDFVFEGGFIEHFQITSAKETKKGSHHKKKNAELDRDFDAKMKEQLENLITNREGTKLTETHEQTGHKHSYLLKSLSQNCTSHLNSLETSNLKNIKFSFFMIQYTDGLLEVKNIDEEDLKHRLDYTPFYPHLDKQVLKLIQGLSNRISHVIFVFQANSYLAYPYDATFEIFSTKNLESLISQLEKENYDFIPIDGMSVTYEANIHDASFD
ncbi:MAG: hypothetical protein KIB10_12560 [Enterococcus avium]|jgi:hypothetical protein|nr:hypothetical protein [Enterococcus avium]